MGNEESGMGSRPNERQRGRVRSERNAISDPILIAASRFLYSPISYSGVVGVFGGW
jgi:hypothetical protein